MIQTLQLHVPRAAQGRAGQSRNGNIGIIGTRNSTVSYSCLVLPLFSVCGGSWVCLGLFGVLVTRAPPGVRRTSNAVICAWAG